MIKNMWNVIFKTLKHLLSRTHRGKSCAGRCRSVPVAIGIDRCRLVPLPTEIAERSQETLYEILILYFFLKLLWKKQTASFNKLQKISTTNKQQWKSIRFQKWKCYKFRKCHQFNKTKNWYSNWISKILSSKYKRA